MMTEMRPIRGEDPGTCQAIDEDGRRCAAEAVVTATVRLPDTGMTVEVRLCRLDWAAVDNSN